LRSSKTIRQLILPTNKELLLPSNEHLPGKGDLLTVFFFGAKDPFQSLAKPTDTLSEKMYMNA
jgi:hypothetical protein